MSNIKAAIDAAIVAGVTKAVASPKTEAKYSDRKEISEAVIEAAGPILAHVTNGEPIYQSRVFWGLVLLVMTRLLAHFGYAIPDEYHGQLLTLLISYGPYAAAALIAWGRFAAKKPMFSGWFGKAT